MVDLYQVGLSKCPSFPHSKLLHLCQIIIFLELLVQYPSSRKYTGYILNPWVTGSYSLCSAPVEVGYIPEMIVVRAGAQTGALKWLLYRSFLWLQDHRVWCVCIFVLQPRCGPLSPLVSHKILGKSVAWTYNVYCKEIRILVSVFMINDFSGLKFGCFHCHRPRCFHQKQEQRHVAIKNCPGHCLPSKDSGN